MTITVQGYLEVHAPGDLRWHVYPMIGYKRVELPPALGEQDLLARTQGAVRDFIRQGVAVFDPHGWTGEELPDGLVLLNPHDREFIFATREEMFSYLSLVAA